MTSLDALHDATLLRLEVDWSTGEFRCDLRVLGQTRVRLVAHGLTSLMCPREFPWGPSVSVNRVRLDEAGGGRVLLFMEMQSGDVIEANLQDLALE